MNRVLLVGNLGKEPELIKVKDNVSIVNFTLATKKKLKNGEVVIQWHNCTGFGARADSIAAQLKKGSLVMIEGEIQYKNYEKDGIQRTFAQILINNISSVLKTDQEGSLSDKHVESSSPTSKSSSSSFECALDDDEVPF